MRNNAGHGRNSVGSRGIESLGLWLVQTFPPRVRAYGQPATYEGPYPQHLPDADEQPDLRGPSRFIGWLMWKSRGLFGLSFALSVLWNVPSGLMAWFLGKALDSVLHGQVAPIASWTAALALCLVVSSIAGTLMHTVTVALWVGVFDRVSMLVNRKALQLGHHLGRRVPAGEALSVANSDSDMFGGVATQAVIAGGQLLAFVAVSVVMLAESFDLGLLVLVATPVTVALSSLLMRPLQHARSKQRSRLSTLTGMATDIVGGLRVLRGIGGERTFGRNYDQQSQSVKRAGLEAAPWQSSVDALGVMLSGLLLVVIAWLGVGKVQAGVLNPGQLVSFFGFALFLTGPIQSMFQFLNRWGQGLVSARKTIVLLSQEPPAQQPSDPLELPDQPVPGHPVLADDRSGFTAAEGCLTVVVNAAPDESAQLADRLGLYLGTVRSDEDAVAMAANGELTRKQARQERLRLEAERERLDQAEREAAIGLAGVRMRGVELVRAALRQVRERIMVLDISAGAFAGTLQELLDPRGRATRGQAEQALLAASADDVFALLPGGWQGPIDERGRGLSGGQRQRLVLARALLADPEVLVAVEPTSAVDAHTEARIAERVAAHRAGRATIVTTVSPLWLHHADQVVFMANGQVVASGTHDELMQRPDYRQVVVRGEDESPQPEPVPEPVDPPVPGPGDWTPPVQWSGLTEPPLDPIDEDYR